MSFSRRRFMQWTASIAAGPAAHSSWMFAADPLRPGLLPSQKEIWNQQVWMAKLGPKYTGNPAHATFVDFLAARLKKTGLRRPPENDTLPPSAPRRVPVP